MPAAFVYRHQEISEDHMANVRLGVSAADARASNDRCSGMENFRRLFDGKVGYFVGFFPKNCVMRKTLVPLEAHIACHD